MVTTIGIAGITGRVARYVVLHLLKYPDVNIRGLCRKASKLPESITAAPNIHIIEGDSNDTAALRELAKGCDSVICCYLGDNTLMTDGQKLLIDVCEAEGVPRFFTSDWTIDYRRLDYGQIITKDPMKKVEEYLHGKKIKGVHVLIGVFTEIFFSAYFQTWYPEEMKLTYWGNGEDLWEFTTYSNAAEYTAALAMDPNATGFFQFVGETKNIKQIADTFEAVYGKRPKLENLGSFDDLSNLIKSTQLTPENFLYYISLAYKLYCNNGQTYLTNLDNSKFPEIHPVTLQEFLKTHSMEELALSIAKL